MPEFHIICGFLGAGKTTYSKKIALEINAEHLEADNLCMSLFSQEEYENHWEDCFTKTVEIMWKKAALCAQKGKNVIFDTGFWSAAGRKDAEQRAQQLGFTPIIDYIYAPDDILKARIAQRQGEIARRNLQNFDKTKQLFEAPGENETFNRIDNY